MYSRIVRDGTGPAGHNRPGCVLPTVENDDIESSISYLQEELPAVAEVDPPENDEFFWDDNVGVFEDDDNSKALVTCQRTILKPYYICLKLVSNRFLHTRSYTVIVSLCALLFVQIGWRAYSFHTDIYDSYVKKVVNCLVPVVIVSIIVAGFGSQEVICFNRGMVYNADTSSNGSSFVYVQCNGVYVRRLLLPSILILSSYFFGFYLFRYSQTEHLSNLAGKVFLGYTDKVGHFSQKKLVRKLRILGLVGILWLVLTVPLNILRVFSLKLTHRDTYFHYLSSYNETYLVEAYGNNNPPASEVDAVRYVLIIFSLVGFVFNDLFYIAAVINYALQCQLIHFLVNVTVNRIANNHWKIDHSIKEIKVTRDFLKVLNGGLQLQMSLLLYLLIGTLVYSVRALLQTENMALLDVFAGILNALQWLFLILYIVLQATRLTIACKKIRNLGMNLRSRPYLYSKTSQLDLDSFILYTSSITVDARLVHIPMKPVFVFPVLFAIATIWTISITPF